MDILKRVEETLGKGLTVWTEIPDVPGFEVQVAFVGREEFSKLYNKFTKKKWSKRLRRDEDVTDRDGLLRAWADRAIKDWRGLTLGKLKQLIPLGELQPGESSDAVVDAESGVKFALLKHNTDFDQLILQLATDMFVFEEELAAKKEEAANLKL